MAYFPFFVDIAGADGLVVGGGTVALRKVEKLLPYSPRLTVVAPEIRQELEGLPGMARRFAKVTERLMERGAWLNARIVPGGEHCEASWERQIPFFMETLFYGLE